MKSVLISIQPKWCELIASGKKTVEVRKSRPRLDVPFKCYIYCTKGQGEAVWRYAGEYWYDTQFPNERPNKANGKVIGEFVCDYVESYWFSGTKDEVGVDIEEFEDVQRSCLSAQQILDYQSDNDDLYYWHISDLVIYDKPKELNEFRTLCKYRNDDGSCRYREVYCDCVRFDFNPDCSVNFAECLDFMTRPPQSWCYVEGVTQNER